jgi:hypothetical protein
MYSVPRPLLEETFAHFRGCGRGRRECQVLWSSPWAAPEVIAGVVHPRHQAHAGGFELDDAWLSKFWLELSVLGDGARVQVHTHPLEAFHSSIDDEFPFLKTPGFLSLVVPDYGLGAIGFDRAYLAEVDHLGQWRRVQIESRLRII